MPTSEYINDRKVCREGTTLTYGDSLPSDTLRTLLYNSSVASSPHCHWLVYSEVPTFRNINWQSVDDAFFPICSFLAHRQVVTRSNQLFAQIFSRHNERWACMLCGVTPSNCFFDLRFISSRHHPFLRAMSPSGQQVGGNRWLSHARWCCGQVALRDWVARQQLVPSTVWRALP